MSDLLHEVIALARQAGACYSVLGELERLKDWNEAIEHPRAAGWAYWYARNVVKGPWPQGEAAILKSLYFSVQYAYKVIGGRFPSCEPLVMKSLWLSLIHI